MFNLPFGTVGVRVSILPLRDGVKVDDALTRNVVLLVRDEGVSKLVSTQKIVIQFGIFILFCRLLIIVKII